MKIFYTAIFLILISCSSTKQDQKHSREVKLLEQAREDFGAGLNKVSYFGKERPNDKVINLGHQLFYDTRLSKSGTVSCSKCHLPQLHFTDGLNKSIGESGKSAPRNAQTLINTAAQISQHWDGNRNSVEHQAERSFFVPIAYNLKSSQQVKEKLIENSYQASFKEAFGKDIQKLSGDQALKLATTAIGAFERTLVGASRFDDYLSGDVQVLSTVEKRGLKKFMEIGCSSCHGSSLVGGQMYQKFGLVEDPYKYTKSTKRDLGRFNHTKDEDDKEFFKVPPLRNVTMTSPYFHDGSVKDLDKAIYIMGKVQLGEDLSQLDRADIIAFLKTLETKEDRITELFKIPTLP